MKKILYFLFFAPVISFSQPDDWFLKKADSIIYGFGNGSVSPPYQYYVSISVTKKTIMLTLSTSKNTKTERFSNTEHDFNKVLNTFKPLKIKKVKFVKRVGGGSHNIAFYHGEEVLLTANTVYDDIEGADIDLSYLIPGFKGIMDSIYNEHREISKELELKEIASKEFGIELPNVLIMRKGSEFDLAIGVSNHTGEEIKRVSISYIVFNRNRLHTILSKTLTRTNIHKLRELFSAKGDSLQFQITKVEYELSNGRKKSLEGKAVNAIISNGDNPVTIPNYFGKVWD